MSDDPLLLIPEQSTDYPGEINSFREHSLMESTSSSWVNLDSDSSRPSGSGGERASTEASVQEKPKALEQTVATLQAQLQAPESSVPKIRALNATMELVKDTIPTEVLVAADSPKKEGGRSAWAFFSSDRADCATILEQGYCACL